MKLFLSLQSFTYHIVNIRVWKYVFTCVVIKIKIFHSCRTCVACVATVSHSCCSCLTCVALVSHSCCSCLTHVPLVSLVLYSCCIHVARVWHSCCKLDQIKVNNVAVLDVRSAALLETFLIKQDVLFLPVSNVLGVCRGVCVRSHTSCAEAC